MSSVSLSPSGSQASHPPRPMTPMSLPRSVTNPGSNIRATPIKASTSDNVTFANPSKDVQNTKRQENSPVDEFNRVKEVAFIIVFLAFNIFCALKVGTLWTMCFFAGAVAKRWVNSEVTEFVKGILASNHAAKIFVPVTLYFFVFQWPGALPSYAALAGASLGSSAALWVQNNIIKK